MMKKNCFLIKGQDFQIAAIHILIHWSPAYSNFFLECSNTACSFVGNQCSKWQRWWDWWRCGLSVRVSELVWYCPRVGGLVRPQKNPIKRFVMNCDKLLHFNSVFQFCLVLCFGILLMFIVCTCTTKLKRMQIITCFATDSNVQTC